jgi:hypothetical protein
MAGREVVETVRAASGGFDQMVNLIGVARKLI